MRRFLLIAIVAFLFALTPAVAVTFDATVSPTTINSDSDNVLVNFTVNNTGAVGIVQINLTLPSGFSYYGSSGSNVSSDIVLYSPPPSGPWWYNKTVANILNAGGSSHFWFKVISGSPDNYEFNVSTLDSSNAFTSENVTVTAADQTAPAWSSNSTTPSSPTAYVSNQSYIFNVTWLDNDGLESVKFEWDQTAPNYTNATTIAIQNLGSGKYSITFRDLTTGNYTYRWYSDDASGKENSTDLLAYNITVADNPINLYFNGNLNQGLTINDGEQINVTATGGGLTLYRNETVVSNPYVDVLPIGGYQFKANSSGNANYTSNATGVSYFLNVVYPAPKYSVSTSIPTTWSLNSYALFNITWSDENDANGFSIALIELNHSGTATNYTMTRRSGTNVSTYELNLSTPMTLTWRVYANNSYNVWNSTSLTTVTAGKIIPTIILTATPAWTVARTTQTSVHCTSDQVSVVLYREGVSVSNPDIQTLGTGDYFYWCNSSATANYSAASNSSLLTVLRYVGQISFSTAESLISVRQGSSGSTIVVVENSGNASQTISFQIDNITSSWYTINATEAVAAVSQKVAFLVNFTIEESVEIDDYSGGYTASDNNSTITSSFVLRVEPKEEAESDISDDIAIYKVNMTKVWADINSSKGVANVTTAEEKILQAKEKIELAESYIASGDYFSAYQLFDEIATLISDANDELQAALEASGVDGILGTGWPHWTTWVIVIVGICVGGFLLYLFWPQSGYNPKTGRYTHKSQKSQIKPLSKVKEKLKVKPKSEISISDIKIEGPMDKTGRYTVEKSKRKKIEFDLGKTFSKIKNVFKRKKVKEVEIKAS